MRTSGFDPRTKEWPEIRSLMDVYIQMLVFHGWGGGGQILGLVSLGATLPSQNCLVQKICTWKFVFCIFGSGMVASNGFQKT